MYKTIALELLQQTESPARLTLLTVSAHLLKQIHLHWIIRLNSARPADSHEQISSEAMELAIKEFQDLLPANDHAEEHSQTA